MSCWVEGGGLCGDDGFLDRRERLWRDNGVEGENWMIKAVIEELEAASKLQPESTSERR